MADSKQFTGDPAEVKGAKLEHPKVFTVKITLGQGPVPFWYRQTRVDGNIARTGRWSYSSNISFVLEETYAASHSTGTRA